MVEGFFVVRLVGEALLPYLAFFMWAVYCDFPSARIEKSYEIDALLRSRLRAETLFHAGAKRARE